MRPGHLQEPGEPGGSIASWEEGLGTGCDKGVNLKEKDPSKRDGGQAELPTHPVRRAGPAGEDLRFGYISPGHYQ